MSKRVKDRSRKGEDESLEDLIQAATGAAAGDLSKIESIMRDYVFHSTLDWQSRGRLVKGAQEAYAVLKENRGMFNLDHQAKLALLEQMRTESAAAANPSEGNIRVAEAAEATYLEAKARLTAWVERNL